MCSFRTSARCYALSGNCPRCACGMNGWACVKKWWCRHKRTGCVVKGESWGVCRLLCPLKRSKSNKGGLRGLHAKWPTAGPVIPVHHGQLCDRLSMGCRGQCVPSSDIWLQGGRGRRGMPMPWPGRCWEREPARFSGVRYPQLPQVLRSLESGYGSPLKAFTWVWNNLICVFKISFQLPGGGWTGACQGMGCCFERCAVTHMRGHCGLQQALAGLVRKGGQWGS